METCPTCKGERRVQEGTGQASSEGGEDWREIECPDCYRRQRLKEMIDLELFIAGGPIINDGRHWR